MLIRLAIIVAYFAYFAATTALFAQDRFPELGNNGEENETSYLEGRVEARFAAPGLAALGEKLFFDPRLSATGRTSCATCHDPKFAFAEPKPTSIFDGGKIGPRNSPSLLASPYLPRLMWDGRFGSLEEQVRGPLSAGGEMGNDIDVAADRIAADPYYGRLFQNVFGEPPSPVGIARAIAAFERSLISGWSPFDRFSLKHDGRALTDFERFGFDLFMTKARCTICHQLPGPGSQGYALFTDFQYHNLGVGFYRGHFKDKGLGTISGRPQDTGAFRTPSLRNVAVTGPYMHDGSLPSLHEVVEFYNAGGVPNPYQSPILRPLGLSQEEKHALVAFLKTLTSEDFGGPGGFRGRESARLGPED
jgi:cytochrome c peroxidase